MKNYLLVSLFVISLLLSSCDLFNKVLRTPAESRVATSSSGGTLSFNLDKEKKVKDLVLKIPKNGITYYFYEESKLRKENIKKISDARTSETKKNNDGICPPICKENEKAITLSIKRPPSPCNCPPGHGFSVIFNPDQSSISLSNDAGLIVAEFNVQNSNIPLEKFDTNFK